MENWNTFSDEFSQKSEFWQDLFAPHPSAYKLHSLIKHKQNLLKPKTERGGEVDAMIGFGRAFVF